MVLLVLASAALLFNPDDTAFTLKEIVYSAEVHGRREAAAESLRAMLETQGDQEMRRRIIRAMSVVKHGASEPLTGSETSEILANASRPQALILYRNIGRVLVVGHWLESGDWLGDYFLLEANPQKLVLEHRDGLLQEVALVPVIEDVDAPLAVFFQADIRDALTFLTRQLGLNSFIPSGLDREVSGSFPFDDWLSLLDGVCNKTEMTWTRRGESLIFRMKNTRIEAETIKLVDRRNEDLVTFLQNLALTFDMELILEGDLSEIKIDIHLQDQPWDEVLECLSIMNDFTWFLIREPNERARLFIQKG